MARPLISISLSAEERTHLKKLLRRPKAQVRLVIRARIVLLADEGLATKAIAERLRVPGSFVSKWRMRFARERMGGLLDDFRPGRPPKDEAEDLQRQILAKLDAAPPAGFAQWDGTLLSQALGIKPHRIWKVLRTLGLSLKRRRSWCLSTDPQFTQKAADVVGLYLAQPEHAVVFSFDEKPCIQALERAQGWLKMPDGKALTGFAHEYKRHGTSTLFAALNVATGQVIGGHFKRKRRVEFLRFMDQLIALHPGKELHVILDNLSTHRVEHEPWLKAHPQIHFHFTPTHASWLNQIEVWFSILSAKALRGASFRSVKELIAQIDAFIAAYNKTAQPFVWTKVNFSAKTLASKYSNLIN